MTMKHIISLALTLCMILSFVPSSFAASEFSDLNGHWAEAVMLKANEDGLLFGSNGKMDPEGKLTRAHIAAIVTRAFGATYEADMSAYTDVPADAWYYQPIARAVGMGIMANRGMIKPNEEITRQEAFLILASALNLCGDEGNLSALDNFSDKAEISEYAKAQIADMAARGYVKGKNGKMEPNSKLTRAEFAALFSQIFTRIHTAGDLSVSISGNVLVNANSATLSYCNIDGDLILGDGVDSVSMVGVSVSGDILIRGGKERVDMGGSTTAFGKVIVLNSHNTAKIINSSALAMANLEILSPAETTGNFTNVVANADLKINSGVMQRIDCNVQGIKIESSGIIYYAYANANDIVYTGTGYNGIVIDTGVTGIILNGNPLLSTVVSGALGGIY